MPTGVTGATGVSGMTGIKGLVVVKDINAPYSSNRKKRQANGCPGMCAESVTVL